MVGVKDNYLFRECAGYQSIGRCTCGSKQMEQTFTVPTTYFGNSEYGDLRKIIMKVKVESWVED